MVSGGCSCTDHFQKLEPFSCSSASVKNITWFNEAEALMELHNRSATAAPLFDQSFDIIRKIIRRYRRCRNVGIVLTGHACLMRSMLMLSKRSRHVWTCHYEKERFCRNYKGIWSCVRFNLYPESRFVIDIIQMRL